MIKTYVTAKGAARSPKTLKEGDLRLVHESLIEKFIKAGIVTLDEKGLEETEEKENKQFKRKKK